jgi:hypothetical protein
MVSGRYDDPVTAKRLGNTDHGAATAGLAYALLQIAKIRDDERLLAIADIWCTPAATQALVRVYRGERAAYHPVDSS